MGWKNEMGVNKIIVSLEIDTYLTEHEFTQDIFEPTNTEAFYTETSVQETGQKCLYLKSKNTHGNTNILYVTGSFIFLECFDFSGYHLYSTFEEIVPEITIEDLDKVLDRLL